MTNKEKFLSLVTPANNETLEAVRFRDENKAWLRESKRIAMKVLKVLKSLGLSQKDLAEQMGVSPQYVNKLVKGKENFTLETLVKLQSTLSIPLLAGYDEQKRLSEIPNSVQLFNIKTSYKMIEFSEYNSLGKKVVGL